MELEIEAKKLVNYINSLGLQIPRRIPPHKHVGAIIGDAVLQIGHDFEKQVRSRIMRLREEYPEAATISGFLRLLETTGVQELLHGWKGIKEQKRVYDHAKFFAVKGIDTFEDLVAWLKYEENRDELIAKGLGIRDRTADYYCVLAGLPEAVKVDSRVQKFLSEAGINVRKYEYNELRTIVQLAAKQLGKRPIDLDSGIWRYNSDESLKGERRKVRAMKISQPPAGCYLRMRDAKEFARCFCEEMENINNLKPIGEFKKGFLLNTVRRGKYKKLFEKYGMYEKFKRESGWEGEENPDCREYISQCERATAEYDRL